MTTRKKPGTVECRTPAEESSVYVGGLKSHGKLVRKGEKLKAGATHAIEACENGKEVVVRKRFSAI